MRLRGRGLPGEPNGDQYVVLEVAVPPAENSEQRALYERLRDAYRGFDPRAGR
jgi:curved DNA-binding protein